MALLEVAPRQLRVYPHFAKHRQPSINNRALEESLSPFSKQSSSSHTRKTSISKMNSKRDATKGGQEAAPKADARKAAPKATAKSNVKETAPKGKPTANKGARDAKKGGK